MADEKTGDLGTGPLTGLVPLPPTDVEGLGQEPEPLTVQDAIRNFTQRRHRVGVFERARILFDPKSLPGKTPQQAMEFLLEGLRIDDPEVKKKLIGAAGVAIRQDFSGFIESLNQQNNDATVAEIWSAVGADPITKMALQWEIQRKDQLVDQDIEESADRTTADLRKLNAMLKKLKGVEFFIFNNEVGERVFKGLTVSDGEGLQFIRDPDNVPYRNLVFGEKAVYLDNRSNIQKSELLTIPLEARRALRTAPDAEYWKRYHERGGFLTRRDHEYDPENNFLSIIAGEEISRLRGLGYNDAATETYDRLAKVLHAKTPKVTSA